MKKFSLIHGNPINKNNPTKSAGNSANLDRLFHSNSNHGVEYGKLMWWIMWRGKLKVLI